VVPIGPNGSPGSHFSRLRLVGLPRAEFANETDAGRLRYILMVKEGAGSDYWWVECGASRLAGRFRTTPSR